VNVLPSPGRLRTLTEPPCASTTWRTIASHALVQLQETAAALPQPHVANQRKRAGLSRATAVREAAAARLRPILMTRAATLFGVLPIALSLGGAAGSRQSLGIAVVGGLLFSTGLTLYVVPAVYEIVSREAVPDAERAAAPAAQPELG
jgi:Cu/Ag efflux pump CusA